jgi:hypothetical protein
LTISVRTEIRARKFRDHYFVIVTFAGHDFETEVWTRDGMIGEAEKVTKELVKAGLLEG